MDIRKTALTVTLLTFCAVTLAVNLKSIQRAIDKNKLKKAEKLILRSLEKDSLNPGAFYYYAVLFLREDFARADLDSARILINRSLETYQRSTEPVFNALEKAGVTHSHLIELKRDITQRAFSRSMERMSQQDFNRFMLHFPDASQFDQARYLRDSLAYDSVRQIHTWQAYQGYFHAFPESAFFSSAKSAYQTLIFKDHTGDDRLESYISFLERHPDTPFRKLTEEIIFTRSTTAHTRQAYLNFLAKYPGTHLRKKVADILYYMSKTDRTLALDEVLDLHPDPDSLRRMSDLELKILFPVFENGLYGFWSTEGAEAIAPTFGGIPDHLLCGDVRTEWLEVLKKGKSVAVSRTGREIFSGNFDPVGAAIVLTGSGYLHHKAGFRVSDVRVDAARELVNGWIAYEQDYQWGIMTPAGHVLLSPAYEDIRIAGDFVILERENLYAVLTKSNILSGKAGTAFKYDDYDIVGDSLFQGYAGPQESLLDRQLTEFIAPDTQQIHLTPGAWYVRKDSIFQVFNQQQQKLIPQTFPYFDANEGWMTFDKGREWLLVSRLTNSPVQAINQLDSVKLISRSASVIIKGDSVQLLFQNGIRIAIKPTENVRLLGSNDQEFFLVDSNQRRVYNAAGEVVLEGRYEEVAHLADTLFKVKTKGKTGVMTMGGHQILPAVYDLVDEQEGLLFLLRNGKIGCYDRQKKVLIPADYESRIVRFGSHYQIRKNGQLGMIDATNSLTLPAEFDQFKSWNDTSVWARKSGEWQLLTFTNRVLLSGFQSISDWLNAGEELLLQVMGVGGYGLLSNVRGEVLPASYNDILNVGSSEEPVIFAEQHLKTAAFFVVTYFNVRGEAIRSQAFRPSEYEMIFCDQ